MVLCDQLQAAQTEREQNRDRLVASSLHRLAASDNDKTTSNPAALNDHARFIFNHLPRLTTRPAHIKQLRQTILNLAVRGKLVAQDPNDELVEKLLKRIKDERNKKEIVSNKKQKVITETSNPEGFFDIPDSWCWVQLGEIANVLMGQSPPSSTYNKSGEGVALINAPVEFSDGPFGITIVNQYTTAPTTL